MQDLLSGLSTIPAAQDAQEESVAAVQLMGESQFGTGVHATQVLGVPLVR
jgi:hypothetical protein